MEIKKYIHDVPNFPKEGIIFRDVTPLLNNAEAFHYVIDEMSKFIEKLNVSVIIAPEARGFIFGAAVAYKTNKRFVPVRKPGKLPQPFISQNYVLEYGSNTLEMSMNSLHQGDKVVIIDDVLATGGTLIAIEKMIEKTGAELVGISVLIDLAKLHSSKLFDGKKMLALVKY